MKTFVQLLIGKYIQISFNTRVLSATLLTVEFGNAIDIQAMQVTDKEKKEKEVVKIKIA